MIVLERDGGGYILSLQAQIIKDLHVKPTIDPKEEIRIRIDFLKNYLKKTNAKGFVLGISGGQDSTLAGKLAQLAVEELRQEGYEARFVAIRLPYGKQMDEDDATLAIRFINPDEVIVFNIKGAVDALADEYNQHFNALSDYNKGNVKARMRMVAQYAVGGERNLLVIGTDHAAESITGFFTKYGDGAADILPLSGLTKRQGKLLLKELEADERLYLKTPTADLLDEIPGRSDEEELGISYDEIDDYLEGKKISATVAKKIEEIYLAREHKRRPPVSMFDDWWK